MSKTRWDRNRRARSVAWDSEYVTLSGGIDERSDALNIKPGRLVQCMNWEQVFGKVGYRTVRGYERYDGNNSPSDAVYHVLNYDAGTAAINASDAITNLAATATARVVSNTITSGSVGGGDAAGVLVITAVVGTFADDDQIRVGGVQKATANGASEQQTYASDRSNYETRIRAARAYYRGLISAVPGEGEILGGCVFDGFVYAVRNAVGSATAVLHFAVDDRLSAFLPNGWTAVVTGLAPSVDYRFEVANFSGDTEGLSLFMVNGRNRVLQLRRTNASHTTTWADDIWGTEGTSTSNVAIGLGAKTVTVTGAGAKDWTAGDILILRSLADWSKSMTGTITAYNSGTGQLDMNITSTSGAGNVNDWDIGASNFSDRPYMLREFKDHMWYAYPYGQLQTSDLGSPLTATTTAAIFGVGQEITGMESLKGKALAVFGNATGILHVFTGSSSLDWDKDAYGAGLGVPASTIVSNDGNPIFLGPKGVSTLQATQSFGDFETANFSADIKRTLDALRSSVVCARLASNNYQYRLYFNNGTNLRFTIMTGNAVITPDDVAPTVSQYPDIPSSVFSGQIEGDERMFFGTTDGFVMEEDVGTSFDGEAISYAMRLPYHHIKGPSIEKEFHKFIVVQESRYPVTLNFRYFFDNEDGTYSHGSASSVLSATLLNSLFDVGAFDSILFDQSDITAAEGYMDGTGVKVSLLFWIESDMADETTLQGLFLFFTKLGVRP